MRQTCSTLYDKPSYIKAIYGQNLWYYFANVSQFLNVYCCDRAYFFNLAGEIKFFCIERPNRTYIIKRIVYIYSIHLWMLEHCLFLTDNVNKSVSYFRTNLMLMFPVKMTIWLLYVSWSPASAPYFSCETNCFNFLTIWFLIFHVKTISQVKARFIFLM